MIRDRHAPPRTASNNNEVTFNMKRMRAAIAGGSTEVPPGLSHEELIKWICGQAGDNGSDGPAK